MKVVIDVKTINVGRYKNGDSKKIWRRVNRPIKKTEKIWLLSLLCEYFQLMEVSYERSKI